MKHKEKRAWHRGTLLAIVVRPPNVGDRNKHSVSKAERIVPDAAHDIMQRLKPTGAFQHWKQEQNRMSKDITSFLILYTRR